VTLQSCRWIENFHRNMLPPCLPLMCGGLHRWVARKVHKEEYKCTVPTHSLCTVSISLDQVQSPLISNGPSFQPAYITYHVHTLFTSTLKMDTVRSPKTLIYHSLNNNTLKNPKTYILLNICSIKKCSYMAC
jgi:hypothetical protein